MHYSLFRRFMTATVVAVLGVLLLTVAAFAHTVPSDSTQTGTSYRFTTLNNHNDPTFNQLLGLNDNGIAVGFNTDGNGSNHAYELNHSKGHFSAIVPPGATSATATGINDNGDVTGFVAGFLLSSLLHHASFQSIDTPNGIGTTTVNGLNDNGALVGFYVDSAGNTDGFLAK